MVTENQNKRRKKFDRAARRPKQIHQLLTIVDFVIFLGLCLPH